MGKNDHEDVVTVDCRHYKEGRLPTGQICPHCHGSGKAVRIIHKR